MRIRSLIACLLLPLNLAIAQLPVISGYKASTLHQNLSLPVEVIGEGVSEQPSPVLIYVPTATAGAIDGSRNAASLPGLPKQAFGFRLVVLDRTFETPLNLTDGRVKQANVPLFAYVPTGEAANPDALEQAYFGNAAPVAVEPPAAPQLGDAFRSQPALEGQSPVSTFAPTEAPVQFVPSAPAETPEAFKPNATVPEIKTWDEVLADSSNFNSSMTVGQLILDDRQQLRTRMPVRVEFVDNPLKEVILSLARSAKIDFTIGALPSGDPHVTTRFNAPPFAALEQIARQYGVGIYKEENDPLWAIRKVDPETLIARTYSLKEIHLGKSSGASGEESFGSGMESISTSGSRNGSSSSGSNRNSNSSRRTSTASSANNNTGSNLGYEGSSANGNDRFDAPSDILFTIKSILGLIETAPMVSELGGTQTADGETAQQRVSTRPGQSGTNRVNGVVSYNADSNSLFVVGTERQHQWVEEYLKIVDRPVVEIAVDALFVESDNSPSSKVGVDWSKTAVDWDIGTSNLDLGTIGNPTPPSGAILSADGLKASLNAFINETKARVARYPRVVTHNNREVRIATTTNIPIITDASTVAGAVPVNGGSGTPGAGDNSGTIQTNFSSGTQEIGTIITILPSRVGTDKIHVKITIEISTGESSSAGETLTGRIATNSTVYEGEVMIPAGKTLAIGGLERIAESSGIGRVPGVSKIPVFGFLFKKKEQQFSNTNITLFLTPRILDLAALPKTTTRQEDSANIALTDSRDLENSAAKKK